MSENDGGSIVITGSIASALGCARISLLHDQGHLPAIGTVNFAEYLDRRIRRNEFYVDNDCTPKVSQCGGWNFFDNPILPSQTR